MSAKSRTWGAWKDVPRGGGWKGLLEVISFEVPAESVRTSSGVAEAWGTGARAPTLEFANARKFCRPNARWLSLLDDFVTTNFGIRAPGAKFWRRHWGHQRERTAEGSEFQILGDATEKLNPHYNAEFASGNDSNHEPELWNWWSWLIVLLLQWPLPLRSALAARRLQPLTGLMHPECRTAGYSWTGYERSVRTEETTEAAGSRRRWRGRPCSRSRRGVFQAWTCTPRFPFRRRIRLGCTVHSVVLNHASIYHVSLAVA